MGGRTETGEGKERERKEPGCNPRTALKKYSQRGRKAVRGAKSKHRAEPAALVRAWHPREAEAGRSLHRIKEQRWEAQNAKSKVHREGEAESGGSLHPIRGLWPPG